MRAFFVAGCVLALPGLVAAQEPETIAEKPTAERLAADKALLQQKLAELERLQAEIRELRSRLGPAGLDTKQVLVSVRMLEASRKKFKAAGIELGDDGVVGRLKGENKPDAQGKTLSADTRGFRCGTVATRDITRQLERWQQQRLVTVLAEPKMVTVSGRPMQFQVGGEFPVVLPQKDGGVAIQYVKFGTLVDAAPTVLDDGRIHLELRPRIRQIDMNRMVTVGGNQVPGLWIREVDFATELAEGETVVLGGIINVSDETPSNGKAQNSAAARHESDETEFIVLATASIVEGMIPAAEQGQAADAAGLAPPDEPAGAAPATATPATTRR